MNLDDIKEDPGFLRLFFQSIFNILIKPIQLAWTHKEKTLHGYIAAILAIAIFLYFFILGILSSVNYVYGIFYEDQYRASIKKAAIDNLNILYSDFCTNAKKVFHPDLLAVNQDLFIKDSKGNMPCTKKTSNDQFFALSVQDEGATGAVKIMFLRKDTIGKYYFQSVTLKKNNLFWWKIIGLQQEGNNVDIER